MMRKEIPMSGLFTQLSDEHHTLLPLITDVQQAAEAKDRAALKMHLIAAWDALTKELDAHMALEEEEAFPSLVRALGEAVLEPFKEEHREIRALRDLLLASAAAGKVPADPCLILCDLIVAHMQREELMLFPSACEALDLVESSAYR
jgi:iron-sulfur cluster repair protein YtfE (RIC family)